MNLLQGISGVDISQETASKVDAEAKKLGRDDFLKLFVTQLKNQDPLNPMESQEFSAQLAQFSSLEQLFNVNETLQLIKSSQDDSSRLQALDFIGKEIQAEGDTLSLEEGKSVSGYFDLAGMAQCTVAIANEEGVTVRRIPMGSLGAGPHSFQWDGRDAAGNTMEPGLYHFGIVAVNQAGGAVTTETRLSGKVTGVNLEASPARLYVGEIPVSISDVMDIRNPVSVDPGETS